VKAIITTTINEPRNLPYWRDHLEDEDIIIVAGDMKTPHSKVEAIIDALPGKNVYLDPYAQGGWAISEVIGWNSIQRRNIALLEALKLKPDFITTIDDDNFPLCTVKHAWFDFLTMREKYDAIDGTDGWFNPGQLCTPSVTHRGMPLSRRNLEWFKYAPVKITHDQVVVWAHLWKSDPDIDALDRIVLNPRVDRVLSEGAPIREVWAPFNSQSTTIRGEWAWAFPVLPHVGRMDDIWSSYICQAILKIFGRYVHYGYPLVEQVRNPHDLLKDLVQEMLGYQWTEHLVDYLRNESNGLTAVDVTPREAYDYLTYGLNRLEWFPRKTIRFLEAWQADLRSLEATE